MPMEICIGRLQVICYIATDCNRKDLKVKKFRLNLEIRFRKGSQSFSFTSVTTIQNGPYKSGLEPISLTY